MSRAVRRKRGGQIMMRWLLGIGVVLAALGGVVTAQADYEDGQRAWDAGRHSEETA